MDSNNNPRLGLALSPRSAADLAAEVLGDAERLRSAFVPTPRISSGIPSLDELLPTSAAFPGFVTGAPSVGKTSLALRIALTTARAGTPVTIYCLDVCARLLAARLVAASVGADWRFLTQGVSSTSVLSSISAATASLAALPLRLVDAPFAATDAIESTERAAEASKAESGLVIVDGLKRADPERLHSLVQLSMDLHRTVVVTLRYSKRSRRSPDSLDLPLPDYAFSFHLERAPSDGGLASTRARVLRVGQGPERFTDIPLHLVSATSWIEPA